MLCPPITSSESQLPKKVDDEEHKDNVEEEERFKALSCIDRVRMLFWDLDLLLMLLLLVLQRTMRDQILFKIDER